MLLTVASTKVVVKLISYILLSKCSSPVLNCGEDGAAEINRTARLACSFSGPTSIYYNSPKGEDIAYCLEDRQCTSSDIQYVISLTNQSTTKLEIGRVHQSDAGAWTCKDVNIADSSTCNLTVFKVPSCSITSKREEITANKELTVTVSVLDYFCSQSPKSRLQSGDIVKELNKDHSEVFNTSFTVRLTESPSNDINLHFRCSNVTRSVLCGVVPTYRGTVNMETSSAGTIAAAVVTVIIVIILIVTGILFWRWRRHKTTKTVDENCTDIIEENPHNTDVPVATFQTDSPIERRHSFPLYPPLRQNRALIRCYTIPISSINEIENIREHIKTTAQWQNDLKVLVEGSRFLNEENK